MSRAIELFHVQGKYRKAYDHLNEHDYLGAAKLLAPRNHSSSDDYGSSVAYTQRIIAGRWFDPKNPKELERVRQAISHTFDRDCRCEHDCCGCWNGSAWVQHVKGREFIAHANYGANC